jgi:hypothetical protein
MNIVDNTRKAIQCQPAGSAPKYPKFFKECIEMSSFQWGVAVAAFAIGV